MNLLIINQPLNNRGDESAHKGLIRKILKDIPDATIRVLFVHTGYNPNVEQFDVHSPRVEYVQLKQAKAYTSFYRKCMIEGWYKLMFLHPTVLKVFGQYKWADWVICAPGGIDMGGFQSWGHLFMLKMAQIANKPLVYYGRSFGPFPTETKKQCRFKEVSVEMLNYFKLCLVRDSKTAKLADELNVPYMLTTDSAFLDAPIVEIPQIVKNQIGEKPYMVFVPNSLNWHFSYRQLTDEQVLDFFCKVVDEIETAYPDLNIVMLPQLYGYGVGDDIHFFRKIAERKKGKPIIVIPDDNSSDIQQTIISGAQFLIGARYHSVVFALNQAIPFIALNYEHKIAGLLETLGKENNMVDITTALFDETSISNVLCEIRQQLQQLFGDIDAQKMAKKIAAGCFEQLHTILESQNASNDTKKK